MSKATVFIERLVKAAGETVMKLHAWWDELNFRKVTALVTVNFFLFSFVYGNAAAAVIDGQRAESSVEQLIDASEIPHTMGRITQSRDFGTDRMVMVVQDLHCHAEVQRNISDLLGFIDKQYRLDKVYLEGSYGALNTSWLTAITDKDVRQNVADGLLTEGKLTGAEYFSATTGKTGIISGLENEGVYNGNVRRFNRILDQKAAAQNALAAMQADIDALKSIFYNSRQQRLEKTIAQYRNGKIGGLKYYSLLSEYARRLSIPVNEYANVVNYLEVARLERQMDYRTVSRQMHQLVSTLKQTLPYDVYTDLQSKTDNFTRMDQLCVYLAGYARANDLGLDRTMPELSSFLRYIELNRSVNPEKLVYEEKKLTREVLDALSANTSEKETVFLADFLVSLSDIVNNRITIEDYAYFNQHVREFELLWVKYTDNEKYASLTSYLKVLNEYYRVNIERNDTFQQNMASLLAAPAGSSRQLTAIPGAMPSARSVSVVITGGFHTEGVREILESRRISYAVITPNVTQDTAFADRVYEQAMRDQARFMSQAMAVRAFTLEPTPEKALDITTELARLLRVKKMSWQQIIERINPALAEMAAADKSNSGIVRIALEPVNMSDSGVATFNLNCYGRNGEVVKTWNIQYRQDAEKAYLVANDNIEVVISFNEQPELTGRLARAFAAVRAFAKRVFGVFGGRAASTPVDPARAQLIQTINSNKVTKEVYKNIVGDMTSMARESGMPLDLSDPTHANLLSRAEASLARIAMRLNSKEIDPSVRIRTSDQDAEVAANDKEIRVGVFPIAGNPIQWAHVLSSLDAIAEHGLDKVVYVIAGVDARKPVLANTQADRHALSADVLKILGPLAQYSAIAQDTDFDGETNIFRMLQLNPQQKINAYYMVGGDHYNQYTKDGKPDTLTKLMVNKANEKFSFNAAKHKVSAIFIKRGADEPDRGIIPQGLEVQFINEFPMDISSTLVRNGLKAGKATSALAILPFRAYRYAQEHPDYKQYLVSSLQGVIESNTVTSQIYSNIKADLANMAKAVGLPEDLSSPVHSSLLARAEGSLARIAQLLNNKEIDPNLDIRTSERDAETAVSRREVRVGVFPIAGNPIQWAHVLSSLDAIAEHKLDKVVYVIAGVDARKPVLASTQDDRHSLCADTLQLLSPLVKYSAIARDTEFDGETNIFRMLQLNPEQKINAYYMVGGDHYNVLTPNGKPDTLKKLVDNKANTDFAFNAVNHTVSAIFIKRGSMKPDRSIVPAGLEVQFINEFPMDISSTLVRDGMKPGGNLESLSILPFRAYEYVRSHADYQKYLVQGLQGIIDSNPVTKQVYANILGDMRSMASAAGMPENLSNPTQELLLNRAMGSLARIALRLNRGEIDPTVRIRTSDKDAVSAVVDKEVRVGVFPIAGNPIQWAHVLSSLDAIAEHGLDKVIYVIAGVDARKPVLASTQDDRHSLSADVLKLLAPLTQYSAIARDTDFDGETNIFRMLQLNPQQKINAYYMVGGDHYKLYADDKQQKPDTLTKLVVNKANEKFSFNAAKHKVSAIFIKRGADEPDRGIIPQGLEVQFINEFPMDISSTLVRNGLQAGRATAELAILPFRAYRYVKEHPGYEKYLVDGGAAPAATTPAIVQDDARVKELRDEYRAKGFTKVDEISASDLAYFDSLYKQYLAHQETNLRIDGNFLPSARLSAGEREKYLGAIEFNKIQQKEKHYRAIARRTQVLHNRLNGGLGTNFKRESFLKGMWNELIAAGLKPKDSAVSLSAKGSDLYFDIELMGKKAKVSVSEVKLLRALAEKGDYGKTIIRQFASTESILSINTLLDTMNMYGRLGLTGSSSPYAEYGQKTYRELLTGNSSITLDETQICGVFPGIDKQDHSKLIGSIIASGSHGQWGTFSLNESLSMSLPKEGNLVGAIYNEDGVNNGVNPAIVGWMVEERVPLVMLTTTKTGIDKKGGQIGIETQDGNKETSKVSMLELASVPADQKNLFALMGLTEGEEGGQYFNTNTVIINYSVLVPFLNDLKGLIGTEQFDRITGPALIANEKKTKDGKEYIQLEGALGTVILNLANYVSRNDNQDIKGLLKKHNIDRLLRIVNLDAVARTSLFTPVKFPVDFWMLLYSDLFRMNPQTWELESSNPGHLPSFDLDDYYLECSNVLDAFDGVSIRNLDSLSIKGKVKLSGVVLKGNVAIINRTDGIVDLSSNEKIRAALKLQDNQRLVLEDVTIEIDGEGNPILQRIPKIESRSVQAEPPVKPATSERTVTADDGTVYDIPAKFRGVEFGTSGHRGKRGEQVTTGVAASIAQGVCDYLNSNDEFKGKEKILVVGGDPRPNNKTYQDEEVRIALANGFTVWSFAEPMPTPICSYMIRFGDRIFNISVSDNKVIVGGINNTPSHNPFEDDGIKFNPGGMSQGAPSAPEINKPVQARANEIIDSGRGIRRFSGDLATNPHYQVVDREKVVKHYISRVSKMVNFDLIRKAISEKGMKWTFNVQNGASGWWVRNIFGAIDPSFCDIVNEEPKSDFGGLPKGPNTEKWEQLAWFIGMVGDRTKNLGKYNGGGATDGDGDRFFFCDDKGNEINFGVVLALLYNYAVHERGVKGAFKTCVDASGIFEKIGPVATRTEIGFKAFQDDLKDPSKKIVIGGECGSGGMTFGPALDSEGIGHVLDKDGTAAQLLFMEMTAAALLKGKTISDLINELYEKYGYFSMAKTASIGLPVEGDEGKAMYRKIVAEIEEIANTGELFGYRVSSIDKTDGLKIFLEDKAAGQTYWVLIRLSGTGGGIRAYGEAVSDKSMAEADAKRDALMDERDALIDQLIKKYTPSAQTNNVIEKAVEVLEEAIVAAQNNAELKETSEEDFVGAAVTGAQAQEHIVINQPKGISILRKIRNAFVKAPAVKEPYLNDAKRAEIRALTEAYERSRDARELMIQRKMRAVGSPLVEFAYNYLVSHRAYSGPFHAGKAGYDAINLVSTLSDLGFNNAERRQVVQAFMMIASSLDEAAVRAEINAIFGNNHPRMSEAVLELWLLKMAQNGDDIVMAERTIDWFEAVMNEFELAIARPEYAQSRILAWKLSDEPLEAKGSTSASAFLRGGYQQEGYGVAEGAAINGSFAFTGDQGYYTKSADNIETGKEYFVDCVTRMRDYFVKRNAALEAEYVKTLGLFGRAWYAVKKFFGYTYGVRVLLKPGIGGQHTPFQGIVDGFRALSGKEFSRSMINGEYELGKDYEAALLALKDDMGLSWDQIVIDPSSKSGSTDETMMIFSELLRIKLKYVSQQYGFDGEKFADVVFETLHDVNFIDGKERAGKDLFKVEKARFGTDNLLELIAQRAAQAGIKADLAQVKNVFVGVLGNMIFETTNRVDQSRISAFINNSGLAKELGDNASPFIEMFDNVGGRWTADLHMMAFLAYYDVDPAAYWEVRRKGIGEVKDGTHQAVEIANKILDEKITDIALVLPDWLFWFGKSIEQNFNESIWQDDGFANLVAIRQSQWNAQQANYEGRQGRMVINLTGQDMGDGFNTVNVQVGAVKGMSKAVLAKTFANLATTFYGITSTVGNRLIVRQLNKAGMNVNDVNLNDLNNPATKIVQDNLYVRQPFVELGKGLLEKRLKALQDSEAAAPGAIANALADIKTKAKVGALETNIAELNVPGNITDMKALADVIMQAITYANANNRKFVPFIYLEGDKFYELRNYLTELGIEWVLQGTGDQHISYQQVLRQPQKYLPFIISFVPEKTQPGRRAIGFAKGYLDNVSPNLVRDYFAEASYQALTDLRQAAGGRGLFLRLTDEPLTRTMLKNAMTESAGINIAAGSESAAQSAEKSTIGQKIIKILVSLGVALLLVLFTTTEVAGATQQAMQAADPVKVTWTLSPVAIATSIVLALGGVGLAVRHAVRSKTPEYTAKRLGRKLNKAYGSQRSDLFIKLGGTRSRAAIPVITNSEIYSNTELYYAANAMKFFCGATADEMVEFYAKHIDKWPSYVAEELGVTKARSAIPALMSVDPSRYMEETAIRSAIEKALIDCGASKAEIAQWQVKLDEIKAAKAAARAERAQDDASQVKPLATGILKNNTGSVAVRLIVTIGIFIALLLLFPLKAYAQSPETAVQVTWTLSPIAMGVSIALVAVGVIFAVRAIMRLANPVKWYSKRLNSKSMKARQKAIDKLGALKDRKALPSLLNMFVYEEEYSRIEKYLVACGATDEELIEFYTKRLNTAARPLAIQSLGEMRNPKAIPALRAIEVRDDREFDAIRNALLACGASADELFKFATTGLPSRRAIGALAKMKDKRFVPVLMSLTSNFDDVQKALVACGATKKELMMWVTQRVNPILEQKRRSSEQARKNLEHIPSTRLVSYPAYVGSYDAGAANGVYEIEFPGGEYEEENPEYRSVHAELQETNSEIQQLERLIRDLNLSSVRNNTQIHQKKQEVKTQSLDVVAKRIEKNFVWNDWLTLYHSNYDKVFLKRVLVHFLSNEEYSDERFYVVAASWNTAYRKVLDKLLGKTEGDKLRESLSAISAMYYEHHPRVDSIDSTQYEWHSNYDPGTANSNKGQSNDSPMTAIPSMTDETDSNGPFWVTFRGFDGGSGVGFEEERVLLTKEELKYHEDEAASGNYFSGPRGMGIVRVDPATSDSNNGYVWQGEKASKKFFANMKSLRKNDVSKKYDARVRGVMMSLFETKVFKTLSPEDQRFLNDRVYDDSFQLRPMGFIRGFNAADYVAGTEDYFLDWNNDWINGGNGEIFLPVDLLAQLDAKNPALADEFIAHIILCPVLGHKGAIQVQQEFYTQNYPDATKLARQGTKEFPEQYKGLLGEQLRGFINENAAKPGVFARFAGFFSWWASELKPGTRIEKMAPRLAGKDFVGILSGADDKTLDEYRDLAAAGGRVVIFGQPKKYVGKAIRVVEGNRIVKAISQTEKVGSGSISYVSLFDRGMGNPIAFNDGWARAALSVVEELAGSPQARQNIMRDAYTPFDPVIFTDMPEAYPAAVNDVHAQNAVLKKAAFLPASSVRKAALPAMLRAFEAAVIKRSAERQMVAKNVGTKVAVSDFRPIRAGRATFAMLADKMAGFEGYNVPLMRLFKKGTLAIDETTVGIDYADATAYYGEVQNIEDIVKAVGKGRFQADLRQFKAENDWWLKAYTADETEVVRQMELYRQAGLLVSAYKGSKKFLPELAITEVNAQALRQIGQTVKTFGGIRLNLEGVAGLADADLSRIREAVDAADAEATATVVAGTQYKHTVTSLGFKYMNRVQLVKGSKPYIRVSGENEWVELYVAEGDVYSIAANEEAVLRGMFQDVFEAARGAECVVFPNIFGLLRGKVAESADYFVEQAGDSVVLQETEMQRYFSNLARTVAVELNLASAAFPAGLDIGGQINTAAMPKAAGELYRGQSSYESASAELNGISGYGMNMFLSVYDVMQSLSVRGEGMNTEYLSKVVAYLTTMSYADAAHASAWTAAMEYVAELKEKAGKDRAGQAEYVTQARNFLRGLQAGMVENEMVGYDAVEKGRDIYRNLLLLSSAFKVESKKALEIAGLAKPEQHPVMQFLAGVKDTRYSADSIELCKQLFAILNKGSRNLTKADIDGFIGLQASVQKVADRPFVMNVLYAKALIEVRRAEGKSLAQIQAEVEPVVNPLYARISRDGTLKDLMTRDAAKDLHNAWAVNGLLDIFELFNRMPKFEVNTKKMRDGLKNMIFGTKGIKGAA